MLSLLAHLCHLLLLIDIVFGAGALSPLLLIFSNLLLLNLSCILEDFEKFLRMLIAQLNRGLLWILRALRELILSSSSSRCTRDHSQSTSIRIVHIADIVVYLQIKRRLINLDLLHDLMLGLLLPVTLITVATVV